MFQDLEELGDVVDYSKIEDYLAGLVAEQMKLPKDRIVIPPGACIYEDEFTKCGFEVFGDDHHSIQRAGTITVIHDPPKETVFVRHGVMFVGGIRGISKKDR